MEHERDDGPPGQPIEDSTEARRGYSQQLIHLVTQKTRYGLILDILAHPDRAPSLKELEYVNPDKGRTTIADHLDKLVESGIVRKLVVPQGERERSLPHTFYTISEAGYEFLQFHELVPKSEEEMRRDYMRIQKSEDIERYENAPRHIAVVSHEASDQEKVEKLQRLVDLYQYEEDSHSSESVLGAVNEVVDGTSRRARVPAHVFREAIGAAAHAFRRVASEGVSSDSNGDAERDKTQKLRP